MKLRKRIISAIFVVLILSSLCVPVFAVSGSTSGKSSIRGGNSSTFYVNTTSSILPHSVKLKSGTGELWLPGIDGTELNYYGFWEIKVYKKSGDSWSLYSKSNMANKYSYTVSLPRNQSCKIVVYAWRTSTISKDAAWGGRVSSSDKAEAEWKTCPTWKVDSYTRCS